MPKILITKPSADYELLDSGNGEKLERFGAYVLRRPDPQALWTKNLTEQEWKGADASFSRESMNGKWKSKDSLPKEWAIGMSGLRFVIKPTPFKHVGLFPEQENNWQWIQEKIKGANSERVSKEPVKVLNLFGYTGGATLAALAVGAEVVHVDGSKSAITWAKKNAEISGLAEGKVRWIEDDARKFVQREIKRGNKYDAIIMDPPAFGHGAKNEVWKIEEDFVILLDQCKQILSADPLFIIVNGYASGYSAIAYENVLRNLAQNLGGQIESGELAIEEDKTKRLLPAGIFVRWERLNVV